MRHFMVVAGVIIAMLSWFMLIAGVQIPVGEGRVIANIHSISIAQSGIFTGFAMIALGALASLQESIEASSRARAEQDAKQHQELVSYVYHSANARQIVSSPVPAPAGKADQAPAKNSSTSGLDEADEYYARRGRSEY